MNDNSTFEQDINNLEQIVAALEKGDMELDKAMAEYEKAVALTVKCSNSLKNAKLRIEELKSAAVTQNRAENE